ncbi:MAG: tyrosine-type recombinase/integrase [Pseudomonadota bacterium]
MGIVNDRGRWYWVKRVPKRFAGLVTGADGKPVGQVRQALHTGDKSEAKVKAAQIEAARLAEWEAMAAGDAGSARRHYEAARELAAARGFPYRPVAALAEGDLAPLVERLLSLTEGGALASPAATEAVLGTVPEVLPTLPEVLTEYYEMTTTRHIKKSDAQRHKWKLPRERAVRNFLDVVVEKGADGKPLALPVGDITRQHALDFRRWWATRVERGMNPESANKDFGHLSEIWNTWIELKGVDLPNPFTKLRFAPDTDSEARTPPFSREWVTDKLLADGALDGLNEESRDVLLVMVNTGLRPSEITDAPLEDFAVTDNVPHLIVAPHGREVKVSHTRRNVPLLGVSLEAARRIVARGGMKRYRFKAGSWSGLVNKYLANNGLKETPKHSAYSIRHYVENALLAASVDDRVRADILGHKYKRPKYGDGGALLGRKDALALIAL